MAMLGLSLMSCGESSLIVNVGGEADTLTITVIDQNSIVVQNLVLEVGDTAALGATATNALGLSLGMITPDWQSTSPGIASVTQAGVVKGLSGGTTDIVVSYEGATATIVTTVSDTALIPPPPTGTPDTITVSHASVSIEVGQSRTVTGTVRDSAGVAIQGALIAWDSDNPAVATVTASGKIDGVAVGSTVVQATHQGLATSIPVTVRAAGSGPTPVFSDGFESGDLSTTQNNFRWGSGGGQQLGFNVAISNNPPRTAKFDPGSRSLSFNYPGEPDGEDSTAEQRFDMGPGGYAELWLEYWFYLPANYFHRTQGGSPTNDKFLRLWGGNYGNENVGYSNNNPKGGASFDPLSGGDSWLYGQWGDHDSVILTGQDRPHWSPAFANGQNGSMARGEWHQVRWHWKLASAEDANDGEYRLWVDGALKIEKTGKDFYGDNGNFLRWGYLMGWSNSGWATDHTFYIDDFKLFDSNPGW